MQLFEKMNWKWKRMFLGNPSEANTNLDKLFSEFFIEIMMIILNFVTLISFIKRLAVMDAINKKKGKSDKSRASKMDEKKVKTNIDG